MLLWYQPKCLFLPKKNPTIFIHHRNVRNIYLNTFLLLTDQIYTDFPRALKLIPEGISSEVEMDWFKYKDVWNIIIAMNLK